MKRLVHCVTVSFLFALLWIGTTLTITEASQSITSHINIDGTASDTTATAEVNDNDVNMNINANTVTQQEPFAVIAYLPEWRFEGANFDTICQHVSHLIFFSLEPTETGGFSGLDRFPGPHILDAAHKASAKHGCKLMLCFGGNGRSNGFAAMTRSKKSTNKFVKKVSFVCVCVCVWGGAVI